MGFLSRLQAKWELKSIGQVVIVLIVFTCTGFTIMFLKKPVMGLITDSEEYRLFNSILYYLFILPVYFVVLLFYGFIFGQFSFFWSFVKRTGSRFKRKKSQ